jgi:hypothetical protein
MEFANSLPSLMISKNNFNILLIFDV